MRQKTLLNVEFGVVLVVATLSTLLNSSNKNWLLTIPSTSPSAEGTILEPETVILWITVVWDVKNVEYFVEAKYIFCDEFGN